MGHGGVVGGAWRCCWWGMAVLLVGHGGVVGGAWWCSWWGMVV